MKYVPFYGQKRNDIEELVKVTLNNKKKNICINLLVVLTILILMNYLKIWAQILHMLVSTHMFEVYSVRIYAFESFYICVRFAAEVLLREILSNDE